MEEEIKYKEDRIQGDCFQWFYNTYVDLRGLLYHVPNGEKRDPITANKLKAMGVTAGVPDLVLHYYGVTYFLECKTPTGVLSKEQKKLFPILQQHGFSVRVFRSVAEFQKIIEDILADKSSRRAIGLNKDEYYYRHKIFEYLYNLADGVVQIIDDLVDSENVTKFSGIVNEFITDYYDQQAGFEILYTEDFKGFYKKTLTGNANVLYQGNHYIEIPPKQ